MFRNVFIALALAAAPLAWAGTTNIGFSAGLGPLENRSNGNLTVSSERACFSGGNTTLLGAGGEIDATGSVSITMTFQPSSLSPSMGFVLVGNAGVTLTAIADNFGNVTISNDLGDSDLTNFAFPAAANNYMRLEYNTATDTATVFVPGSSGGERSATIQAIALDGATSFQLGVISQGSGCFDDFIASGPSIPDYSDPAPITHAFPLNQAQEVPATGSIATGCATATLNAEQTTLTVHVEHGVFEPSDAHIHLAAAGVNGAVVFPFASAESPIDETFNISPQNAADFLAGNFYVNVHSTDFPAGEIRGQAVDTPGACNVVIDPGPQDVDDDGTLDENDAFPTNPFGQTDSDDDGLGDEWEQFHFGDLLTANDITDSDNDGVSDVEEFNNAILGLDPNDGNSSLPLAGAVGLAALTALLAAGAARKRA